MLGGEINLNNISKKDFGYLKGFFIGDGYKYHDKKGRRYYVEFYVHSISDKLIQDFLLRIAREAGLNPNIYHDKRFYCNRIRITNKEFYFLFDKNLKVMNISKEEILGFISGFLDAEGYVNKKSSFIQIVNTNLQVLKFTKRELAKMGVSSSLTKKWASAKMKLPSYNLYVSVKFKSLPHLSVKVKAKMS